MIYLYDKVSIEHIDARKQREGYTMPKLTKVEWLERLANAAGDIDHHVQKRDENALRDAGLPDTPSARKALRSPLIESAFHVLFSIALAEKAWEEYCQLPDDKVVPKAA
jgi:hypothetical protein